MQNINMFKTFQAELQNNIKQLQTPPEDHETINQMISISTHHFEQLYQDYINDLNLLIKRLSRDNLHISFVGSAGQGKSLVMQNVSGLPKTVIPSSDGGDCTGAKSIIINSDDDEVTAEIIFYTQNELLEIVNQYITVLIGETHCISCIQEIPTINLSNIQTQIKMQGESPKKEEWLDYLRKYVAHYSIYSPNLGKTITVSENEIEQYVAQYSSTDTSCEYFQYLGVKVANIKKRRNYLWIVT